MAPTATPLRLFFGLPVSPTAAAALGAALAPLPLPAGWRWTPRANWHLTLLFLGVTDAAQVPALIRLGERAVAATATAKGELTALGGLPVRGQGPVKTPTPNGMPTPPAPQSLARGARLLAALAADAAPFLPLHGMLAEGARTLGFAIESRPLLPHVTLARRGREAGSWPSAPLPPLRAAFPIDTLVLYRSESSPAGPGYSPLWTGRLQQ